MIEFNPDGSLRLPPRLAQKKQDDENRLKTQKSMGIKKEVVDFHAPKRCLLHLRVSDAIIDALFVDTIYAFFSKNSSVPSRLTRKEDRKFQIEIGTDFRRCTDCCSLVNRYREFLDGNLIEDKGNCTFETRNFSYEDHFS